MDTPNARFTKKPSSHERRRHQRIKLNLLGRYMLADKREYPCQAIDISPGGIALIAAVAGNLGERVIIYLDYLGGFEGVITRIFNNGFAIKVEATARKKDKVATQLTWLANRPILDLPKKRSGQPHNTASRLTLTDGENVTAD